ncbi:MAG: ABC transporter permease [bacterium]|nr:ABC transporter permease [bacterium]
MGILQGIIVGFKEIWAHKLRSFLTMLGVILGVAALASMFAFVEGMFAGWKQAMEEQGGLEKLSTNESQIPEKQRAYRHIGRQRRVWDMVSVRVNVPGVVEVSPEVDLQGGLVRYREKRTWAPVYGVGRGSLRVNNQRVAQGRFITDVDRVRGARVIVLGSGIVEELFEKNAPVLGRMVYFRDEPFRVVGVMQAYGLGFRGMRRGHDFMRWRNRFSYIPLETGMEYFTGNKDLTWLNYKVGDTRRLDRIAEAIQNTLFLTHRRLLNFSIGTNVEMFERFNEITGAFGISLGIIASISLLVGGIGIMNIMLASINERIQEIGIRKAIGARDRDILIQVLVEAVVLSLTGGLLGVGVSLALTGVIGVILRNTFSAPVVRAGPLVFAFCVSVVVGILFGLYPAARAAKLDPIEALRYE